MLLADLIFLITIYVFELTRSNCIQMTMNVIKTSIPYSCCFCSLTECYFSFSFSFIQGTECHNLPAFSVHCCHCPSERTDCPGVRHLQQGPLNCWGSLSVSSVSIHCPAGGTELCCLCAAVTLHCLLALLPKVHCCQLPEEHVPQQYSELNCDRVPVNERFAFCIIIQQAACNGNIVDRNGTPCVCNSVTHCFDENFWFPPHLSSHRYNAYVKVVMWMVTYILCVLFWYKICFMAGRLNVSPDLPQEKCTCF